MSLLPRMSTYVYIIIVRVVVYNAAIAMNGTNSSFVPYCYFIVIWFAYYVRYRSVITI